MKSSDMRTAFSLLDELARDPEITREWIESEIRKLAVEPGEAVGLLQFFDDARARAERDRVAPEEPAL